MKNALNIFSGVVLFVFFAITILLAYWWLYPYNPLVFKDDVFPVVNKTVKRGAFVQYTSNYCKYTSMNATVSRAFINGLIYSTPITTTNREEGCHTITVGIPIPAELPVGSYHLENIYKYQVNPLRTVTIKENTEEFNVVK